MDDISTIILNFQTFTIHVTLGELTIYITRIFFLPFIQISEIEVLRLLINIPDILQCDK